MVSATAGTRARNEPATARPRRACGPLRMKPLQMKLAPRLLLVALVTLLLPWAGCQYVRDLESALRRGQLDTLAATADILAVSLTDRLGPAAIDRQRFSSRHPAITDIYLHPLTRTPDLDGYADDWGLDEATRVTLPGAQGDDFSVRYQAASDGVSMFLFLQVDDDDVIMGEAGDHLRLRIGTAANGFADLTLSAQAPGLFTPASSKPGVARRVRGNWQAVSTGFNLEVQIPLAVAGDRAGFLVTDADRDGSIQRAGTLPSLANEPGWLISTLPAAQTLLENAVRPGQRLRLVDRDGYVLASAYGGSGADQDPALTGLARRILRWVIRDQHRTAPPLDVKPGRIDTNRFTGAFHGAPLDARAGDSGAERVVLEAIRPVGSLSDVSLALLIEEDSERVLSLTDRAASRIFVSSFAVSLSAAALLLGFAAWLSWRIRRLSQAAGGALGSESDKVPALPEDRAGDELGELSRNFSALLTQISEHNQYLQGLGSRITHELSTPMAVVRTSLENLQAESGDHVYLERARQGIERLQAMVAALGAATRMEQAISSAENERFDLAQLLAELGAALQAAHPGRDLRITVPPGRCEIDGAPELVAQMVDKLVENAIGFCPPDGVIHLILSADGDDSLLQVRNSGSQLPPGPPERLFDSMVSARRDDGSGPHLGLGLYIVRLVARHHGGRVQASNLPDHAGVCFGVHLPGARSE